MNGNLVDTNVIIKLMNGDPDAVSLFDRLDNISVSVVTSGELFYGAFKSSRIDDNLKIFKSFLSIYTIIDIDDEISLRYGQVKANLVKSGVNIPENDIWITATALTKGLCLVTYDSYFNHIEGLEIKI